MSVVKIQYGPNFSSTNGQEVFTQTTENKTAKLSVVPNEVQNLPNFKIETARWTFDSKDFWGGEYYTSGENITLDTAAVFGLKDGEESNIRVQCDIYYSFNDRGGVIFETTLVESSFLFKVESGTDDDDDDGDTGSGGNKITFPFKTKIVDVDVETNTITTALDIDKSRDYQSVLSDEAYAEMEETKTSKRYAISYNSVEYENLNVLLNTSGEKSLITNSDIDVETTPIDPYSVVLKLYEPLSNDVGVKDKITVVKEMAEPIRETIRLAPFNDADLGTRFLYEADNKSMDYINNLRTAELSQNEIFTNDNFISGSLLANVLSGSTTAEVNVDYNDYKNFSIFGSVEKRLQNFRTKLQDYEFYSKESSSLAAQTASAVFKSEIVKNEEFKRNITNNFDHYEKYLFYESSSYATSSFGQEFDTSWPKENSTKPHNVLSVSASAATNWYNNNITSASLYDQNNPNRLINLIPEHIKRDSENQPFLDFLDMVGHYYDNIWIHIKAMTDTYDRREKLTEGLSKDLVWTISNAFGWKQPSGTEITELHRLITGQYLSGSFGSEEYKEYSELTGKEIQQEIWNRVLTSMPYILKNKGTKESIQALVNAYGIPPTILKVREYGGSDNKDYQPTFETQQRFTKALDFKNSQHIQTQWKETSGSLRTPDTIEFRFRAASSSNQVLVAKDQRFAVRLLEQGSTTDNKGKVEFLITSSLGTASVTSSLFPVYNNEFWSVGITRESSSGYNTTEHRTLEYNTTGSMKYNLFVKQYESGVGRILYDSSTSMTLSGSTTTVGVTSSLQNGQWTASGDVFFGSTGSFGDLGVEFTGSLQEIRYYNSPLTESAFNNHTRAPKSINGNHISSSFTDLAFRLRLDDNKNLSTSSDLMNIAPDQTLFAQTSSAYQSGSAVGFTANTFTNIEQEEKALTPNVGYGLSNSKVRIEKNWIPSGSALSVDYRTEESSYDTSPIDSNKLGVFFSPTDVINQDIIQSLGDVDFDQEIGDPRDEEELFYRGLRKLSDSYFQKYKGTNNFWDYMRLVKFYDQAIYEQIKKVIPARTKFNFGLLIEPTILERPKEIISKSPSIENLIVEGEINVGLLEATQSLRRPVISITSSRDDYFGVISESLFREPSLYLIGSSSLSSSLNDNRYKDSFVRSATTGSITEGVKLQEVLFNEALSPFVSSSRESEFSEIREIFYTSSAAIGEAGTTSIPINHAPLSSSESHAYSSSFKKAEYQPPSDYLSGYERSVYEGVKNTINTTTDGELPVIVGASSPTAVVSRKAGDGKKLEVVRKK